MKGLFQDSGLGVGAVHDGDVAGGVVVIPLEAFDFPGDGLGLVLLVICLGHGYGDAEAIVGPEALVLALPVAGDDVVGGVEDGLGGAVVLLKEDGPGAGEVLFEAEDVADVGVTPRIDGLVGVADYADVVVLAGQLTRKAVLDYVGVLEFVD